MRGGMATGDWADLIFIMLQKKGDLTVSAGNTVC